MTFYAWRDWPVRWGLWSVATGVALVSMVVALSACMAGESRRSGLKQGAVPEAFQAYAKNAFDEDVLAISRYRLGDVYVANVANATQRERTFGGMGFSNPYLKEVHARFRPRFQTKMPPLWPVAIERPWPQACRDISASDLAAQRRRLQEMASALDAAKPSSASFTYGDLEACRRRLVLAKLKQRIDANHQRALEDEEHHEPFPIGDSYKRFQGWQSMSPEVSLTMADGALSWKPGTKDLACMANTASLLDDVLASDAMLDERGFLYALVYALDALTGCRQRFAHYNLGSVRGDDFNTLDLIADYYPMLQVHPYYHAREGHKGIQPLDLAAGQYASILDAEVAPQDLSSDGVRIYDPVGFFMHDLGHIELHLERIIARYKLAAAALKVSVEDPSVKNPFVSYKVGDVLARRGRPGDDARDSAPQTGLRPVAILMGDEALMTSLTQDMREGWLHYINAVVASPQRLGPVVAPAGARTCGGNTMPLMDTTWRRFLHAAEQQQTEPVFEDDVAPPPKPEASGGASAAQPITVRGVLERSWEYGKPLLFWPHVCAVHESNEVKSSVLFRAVNASGRTTEVGPDGLVISGSLVGAQLGSRFGNMSEACKQSGLPQYF